MSIKNRSTTFFHVADLALTQITQGFSFGKNAFKGPFAGLETGYQLLHLFRDLLQFGCDLVRNFKLRSDIGADTVNISDFVMHHRIRRRHVIHCGFDVVEPGAVLFKLPNHLFKGTAGFCGDARCLHGKLADFRGFLGG